MFLSFRTYNNFKILKESAVLNVLSYFEVKFTLVLKTNAQCLLSQKCISKVII